MLTLLRRNTRRRQKRRNTRRRQKKLKMLSEEHQGKVDNTLENQMCTVVSRWEQDVYYYIHVTQANLQS
jgi:hypothetical protein